MTAKEQRVRALLARKIVWPCPTAAVFGIAMEEDCRLKAYLCTAGQPTNGWGETDGVQLGDVWTQEYADERLRLSLVKWTTTVKRYIGEAPTTDNQLSAMLILAYNIGLEGFRTSTVLKCHKRGDYLGAARAFHLWNKSRRGGVLAVDPVLVGRRQREATVYMTPDDVEDIQKPPQAVESESKLTESPIMIGGATSLGAGAITMFKEGLDSVVGATQKASEVAGTLQVSPLVVMALIAVAVGATSMYWRWKQRREGWA